MRWKYFYQDFPALLLVEPVPHVHDGRKNISWQVDASKPVEPIEEEGDDEHDVDDFISQEEEVFEKHPVFLEEMENWPKSRGQSRVFLNFCVFLQLCNQ